MAFGELKVFRDELLEGVVKEGASGFLVTLLPAPSLSEHSCWPGGLLVADSI